MRAAWSVVGASLLVVIAAACKDPAPPDGSITCGPGGSCPVGYACVAGNTCYREGHSPDLAVALTDLAVPSDLAMPDLAHPRRDGGPTCDDYCLCMPVACDRNDLGFVDEMACYKSCLNLSEEALACRYQHCVYARDGINGMPMDPRTHCPHAQGAFPCNMP